MDMIIEKFRKNVKGKHPCLIKSSHCGQEGHWLEDLMEIPRNSKNAPDILGYEMKKETDKVTTFIDKQTSYKFYEGVPFTDLKIKKQFWNTFARQNSKGIRIGGWKINIYDKDGQVMKVDENNNIIIQYNFINDTRLDKLERVSSYYQNENEHTIAIWNKIDLEKSIENKFNKGFFICKKKDNIYNSICFGSSISFDLWIQKVKESIIYYDGYSSLNGRWRGCFRANNSFWNSLIVEEYS